MRGPIVLRILLACGCFSVVSTLCMLSLTPIAAIGLIGVALTAGEGPVYEWYTGPFAAWLGVGCATGFRLSDEDIERLAASGIPADAIANAEAGRRWCGSAFGANIDIGIVLAIMQSESNFGANMGNSDWLKAIKGNSVFSEDEKAKQEAAGKWLLELWKQNQVRARSPEAAAHIYPGYTGYLGHASAGEIGDGFIPSSAQWVCLQALQKSGDSEVASCNLFTRKVNGHAIPWFLYRNGYSADQSFTEKVDSLKGWNRNLAYRVSLATRAEAINILVGVVNIVSDIANVILEPGKSLVGDFKLFLIEVLESLNLLPERIGWLEMPLREEDFKAISQDYFPGPGHLDPRHPAIDFVCKKAGVDVIAVANGVVIEPNPNTLMGRLSITQKDKNFGNNVWIDHGGLYVVYAHLNSVRADVGDKVDQGEVIGTCGSTGNSTGPHVHLQVLDIHPDEMQDYRQENPGNINPHPVLGTCVAPKKVD